MVLRAQCATDGWWRVWSVRYVLSDEPEHGAACWAFDNHNQAAWDIYKKVLDAR